MNKKEKIPLQTIVNWRDLANQIDVFYDKINAEETQENLTTNKCNNERSETGKKNKNYLLNLQKMEKTCNQCHRPMDYHVESKTLDEILAYVCTYPDCPNYGLHQCPVENMPSEDSNK